MQFHNRVAPLRFCLFLAMLLAVSTTLPAHISAQTYTLDLYTTNQAPAYNISISPEAVQDGTTRHYSQGTRVTLRAHSTAAYTFEHWEDGDTAATRTLTMNQHQVLVAHYRTNAFVVGWDFYALGNADRSPDCSFPHAPNQAVLQLLDDKGASVSWSGYSGMNDKLWFGNNAAMIRRSRSQVGSYYFQLQFSTQQFTNVRIQADFLEVFTHYQRQQVSYSTDGITFLPLGNIDFPEDSTWYPHSFLLPRDAEQKDSVFVRFTPDKTAPLIQKGATTGSSISKVYVLGNFVNDGIHPQLIESSPAMGEQGVLPKGYVRLAFNETIRLVENHGATLNQQPLNAYRVSGHYIEFPFNALAYGSQYTFQLPANTVFDANNNPNQAPVELVFSTLPQPMVSKKVFDFTVGKDGTLKNALEQAKAGRPDTERFYIYLPNGRYNIGETMGDQNEMTTLQLKNVSIIGEDMDSVVLYNTPTTESIHSTATLHFNSKSSNNYLQNLTLLNQMDYRTGVLKGRAVALWDEGNKHIYKRVKLLSNQDTYFTGNYRSYLEACEIHGTTDFICGGGDIFFNRCLLFLEEKSGPVITAPATNGQWGYVFMHCIIDGFAVAHNDFQLGRPWSNSPKSAFLHTQMQLMPSSGGWGNPMNVVPTVFAEFNSMNAHGFPIDLSNRRTTYTKNGVTAILNPVLSSKEAWNYTLKNVLGGTDNWQPDLLTQDLPAPEVTLFNGALQWDDRSDALCWAVYKNDNLMTFTTQNNYLLPDDALKTDQYTIRAVNSMGSLGPASQGYTQATSTHVTRGLKTVHYSRYFTLDGKEVQRPERGIYIVQHFFTDGTRQTGKVYYKNHP